MATVTKYNFRAPLAAKKETIPSGKYGWRRMPTLYLYIDASAVQAQEEDEVEFPVAPVKKGGAWH